MSIGTSQYPTAVDDSSTLGVPADSFSTKPLSTTLASGCLTTDVTLHLAASPASIGAPSSYGIVSIDDEEITYTGVSGNNLTGCVRGLAGTTAIGHSSGAVVKFRYVALFDKAMQAAIVAVQSTVGTTGAFNFLQQMQAGVNAQSGTSYVILDSDRGKLVTGSNASAQAYSIAQAGAGGQFLAGWYCDVENRGVGALTVTPSTSTVDGAASIVLAQGRGVRLFSDGANYFTQRGSATPQAGVNAQSGTSYTLIDGDRGKLVTGSNGSAQAYALPQAGASSAFISGWFVDVENRGAGALTITPATSTIDGAATLVLTQNQGARIFSDGANYFTQRGVGGASGGGSSTLHVDVSNGETSGTSETILSTFTVPGGTLANNNDLIHVRCKLHTSVGSGYPSVIFKFYMGGTDTFGYSSAVLQFSPTSPGNDNIWVEFDLIRLSSTTFACHGFMQRVGSTDSDAFDIYQTGSSGALASGTFAADQIFKVTGQTSVANAYIAVTCAYLFLAKG